MSTKPVNSQLNVNITSQNPTRCPFCHDAVSVEEFENAKVCEYCLSRHHESCWTDNCASCRHERYVGQEKSQPETATRTDQQLTPENLDRALREAARSPAEAFQRLAERSVGEAYQAGSRSRYMKIGWAMSAVLALLFVSIAVVPQWIAPEPDGELPWGTTLIMFAYMALMFAMIYKNLQDHWERGRFGLEQSPIALYLSTAGMCLGGYTTLYYFHKVGRQPLYEAVGEPFVNQEELAVDLNSESKTTNEIPGKADFTSDHNAAANDAVSDGVFEN